MSRMSIKSATIGFVAGAVGVGGIIGGVALAAIPATNTGNITSCVNARTSAVRIIDYQAGKRCVRGEKMVTWSKGWRTRGNWSTTVAYTPGDVVTYNNSSFVARTASTAATPAVGSAAWQLLAAGGTVGPQGAPGAPGSPGAPGAPGTNGTNGTNGSAVAYAHVDGTTVTHSKNVVSVTNPVPGVFCVTLAAGVSAANSGVTATIDYDNSGWTSGAPIVMFRGSGTADCPAGQLDFSTWLYSVTSGSGSMSLRASAFFFAVY